MIALVIRILARPTATSAGGPGGLPAGAITFNGVPLTFNGLPPTFG